MNGGRFRGRACMVTGGGRGIGRAIAKSLAAEGAAVAVAARSVEECEQVAEEIRSCGGTATAHHVDVTDPAACARAVEELTLQFKMLSVLVNAAGISPVRQRSESHDLRVWDEILRTNLTGAYTMTRAAGPALFKSKGVVVMVSSVLAVTASPRMAAYGASKGAMVQLTRTLAREWADRGVRVNAICPSYTTTRMTERVLTTAHLREAILSSIPLGRLASIQEIVAPALFLASDDSSYITGATLVVDGGMTA
jgi:NAD(P)-dependent dehydrogenase (short-subunit alcohol dehydrogenase family)